jgi:biopolymer transport protein TolR
MKQSRKRSKEFRPNSAVNVTPMVDVMLVLLVIFMVTAPMVTVGVKVDLPQTTAPQSTESEDSLIVSIDATGQVFVQETKVEMNELVDKLRAIIGNNKDACVFVRGDKTLKYSAVIDVMAHLANSGIGKISLVAEVPPPPGA